MVMIFSIDLYSTKCNTFILKCFIQFTCTNLGDCQKEGVKRGTQKEGVFLQKRGGGDPTLEETMTCKNMLMVIMI